jgi:MFS family permease
MNLTISHYEKARVSVTAVFFAMGVGVMAAATRFAEIKTQIGVGDAVFGYALALGTLGGLTGNALSGIAISRVGTRKVVLVSATAMPLAVAGFGYAQNAIQLGILSMISAVFYSSGNIAMNAQGVDIEAHAKRSIMPSMHAAWSFGALTSSLGGNVASNFLNPAMHLSINAAVSILLVWTLGRKLLLVDPNAHRDEARKPIPKSAHKMLFLLALTMVLGLIAEISSNDWSAIHLHETLGVPLGLNGLGVTAFLVSQLIARSLGNRLTDKFGSYQLIRVGGLVGGSIYLAAILISPAVPDGWKLPIVLIGIMALGFGAAALPAALMGAVGRVAELSSARAMSALLFYTAGMFLILRPIVSALMGSIGTTATLALTAISLMLATEVSKVLRPTSAL